MVDERTQRKCLITANPELLAKYAARIGELQAELEDLGVKREKINFPKMDLLEIRELGSAIAAQLKQRKKWLGVEN